MRTHRLALGSLFAMTMMVACGSSTNDAGGPITTQNLSDAGPGLDASRADANEPACVDGKETCEGGTHVVCRAGALVKEPCATGTACESSLPACREVICTPGSSRCVDGSKSETCNASGTAWASLSCTSTQGCDTTTGLCAECLCAPGAPAAGPEACADADNQSICSASCLGYEPKPCGAKKTCADNVCLDVICTPGAKRCVDAGTAETCSANGVAWAQSTTCDTHDVCVDGEGCITRCAAAALEPSTFGCSFFALNMSSFIEASADAVILMNPSETLSANVKIYASPGGVETLLADGVTVPPLGSYVFTIPNDPSDRMDKFSVLRKGGSFRIESDLPLQAVQHAPLARSSSNDASCLVPENALGKEYVVGAYNAFADFPSYVDVIATADAQVTVKVPTETAQGAGVASLSAGDTQTFTMSRYDTLQIVGNLDLTGAQITSTAPVAVFGAVNCAQVPLGTTYCDHVEEQMIPIANLGKTYVLAPHAKRTDADAFRWRVIATEDDTAIVATPPVDGFPATLAKGEVFEFETSAANANGGGLVLTSSKRFAAFMYMRGGNAPGAGSGDPLMTTVIPTEQFVSRSLVFLAPDYDNTIQIVRTGKDDVTIDGVVVQATSFTPVGTNSYANVPTAAGVHMVTSAGSFGVSTFGTAAVSSYGAPGAMALRSVAP